MTITEKNRNKFLVSECADMMVGSMVEPTADVRTVSRVKPGLGRLSRGRETLLPGALRAAPLARLWVESPGRRRQREQKGGQPLGTNNLAKFMISHPNDINALRPASRNPSFRLREQFLSLSLFWASPTPETKSPPRPPWSYGRKKLRKGGVKPLKSLARVSSCAGAPVSPGLVSAGRKPEGKSAPKP